jgi:hypothetical protein
LADKLVTEAGRCTPGFPAEDCDGLHAWIRRAAVSVLTNLVEGMCPSRKDYVHSRSTGLPRPAILCARHRVLATKERKQLDPRISELIRGFSDTSMRLA